ncbi:helix-turn-helix transcriptional regulator [Nonomuraea sp. NPDC005650]|uniref:helix-turn-helix domain-containing protein n=1 Tax=Nonomuraea sp. NPDC005650 TaxID=3157045 RepID=UPI0033A8160C
MVGEETFGQVLRHLRGNRTLGAVANAAGISTSYVYKLENGQRKPTRTVVEALEAATNAQGALIEASERNENKSAPNAEILPPIAPLSPVRTLDINDQYGGDRGGRHGTPTAVRASRQCWNRRLRRDRSTGTRSHD